MASYKPVIAALRVLDVLAATNKIRNGAAVGDIHRETSLDKATIVRMLTTLIHAGYVVREQDTATYRVTGKTLQLSSGYDRHSAINAIVFPDLQEFRQQIGWPSDVAILDQDEMIVVNTSRHSEPLQFQRITGFRAPVLTTSLGLAYLANCPETERQDFLELAVKNPDPSFDLARNPDKLSLLLKQVREQSYATMTQDYSEQTYASQFFSIGTPIMMNERVFGSINIIYLRSVLTPDEARASLLEPLLKVAAKMARKLHDRTSNDNK